jgi:hypothetical protein
MNYVPIDTVLNRVPKKVIDELGPERCLSEALFAYRELAIKDRVKTYYTILDINNFTCEIPDEIKSINRVWKTSTEKITIICENSETAEDCIEKIQDCQKCFEGELDYIGNVNNLINHKYENCSNCTHKYSIDHNRKLTTSFKDGILLLSVNAEVLEDEKYLILNKPTLIRYLALSIQIKYWMEKMVNSEPSSFNIYKGLMQEADILQKKFKGNQKLSAIKISNMEEISGRLSTPLRLFNDYGKQFKQRFS